MYCALPLDSRITVSETRREAGRATYVTFVFRAGRVNSTSSSHLGRAVVGNSSVVAHWIREEGGLKGRRW